MACAQKRAKFGRNRRVPENANCTSCATVRELPAPTLWWHRAGGVVSDRRTGATGARGYLVRQWRLTDHSNTAGILRAGVAPRSPMQGSAALSFHITASLGAAR